MPLLCGLWSGVVLNIHLAKISRCLTQDAHAVLVLDGGGWHTSPRFRLPENISLLPLPPYAPELNPIENVWEFLRQNMLSHSVWNSYDAIVDVCCHAWSTSEQIASINRRSWAQVKTLGAWYYTRTDGPGIMQTKVLTADRLAQILASEEMKAKWEVKAWLNTMPEEEAVKVFRSGAT